MSKPQPMHLPTTLTAVQTAIAALRPLDDQLVGGEAGAITHAIATVALDLLEVAVTTQQMRGEGPRPVADVQLTALRGLAVALGSHLTPGGANLAAFLGVVGTHDVRAALARADAAAVELIDALARLRALVVTPTPVVSR